MLWTLQTYIFRELGKTFVLTAVGLVAVIGLGGGVMNMIDAQGLTALQLLKIVGLILPVAATLTLPVAALYSATVTYGRLSADNELTACRSGGINIHHLFLPTLVISLVSATCTFFFINFAIPTMVRNLDRFVGDDMPRIVKQQLSTNECFSIRDKFVIYADRTEMEQTADGKPVLRLEGAAFTQSEDNAWMLFGTARTVLIAFGRQDGMPTLEAEGLGINVYDARRAGFVAAERQLFPEYVIPKQLPVKVKWLTLGGLLQYSRQPATFPVIEDEVNKLRGEIARGRFFMQLQREFPQGFDEHPEYGEVRFGDQNVTYTLRSIKLTPDKEDRRPSFSGNVVVMEQHADGSHRTIRADEAVIDIPHGTGPREAQIEFDVSGNVAIDDPRSGGNVIRREREALDKVALPAGIIHEVQTIPSDELLDPQAKSLRLGDWVEKCHRKVIEKVDSVGRDITGELHARLAFSGSVFVLVILGAALGIVFRGAQVLVAFGISFVPSMFVICMIIMGKRLIDKPDMILPGISVIWLGILIVAAVDLFVLTKVVRR